MELPQQIKAGLEAQLYGVSRRELARRAAQLSTSYRAASASQAVIATPQDALAYAVARMPATYAATATALAEMSERTPDFYPKSVLDLGGGPGTASFAALELWPSIERITIVERNAQFRGLAKAILDTSGNPALASALLLSDDLTAPRQDWPAADLVIASYVGVELPEPAARALARIALAKSRRVVVLIEPGTPAGFARIHMARDELLKLEAVPVAPCPHARACPIVAPDWCHFSVRLARSRDHRLAKGADAPFEDEKFSYLAVQRGSELPGAGARIVAQPHASKIGIEFRLCTPSGLVECSISRRDKALWKAARRLGWGDLLPDNDASSPLEP
ncbi:MAG: small ribosomal subunit Rsm22 family protein [Bacteroidota bacterium]|jgi:ribosomal protein RSM22 (predicted rRNA methylase)